jgi:hypothetical protein
MTYTLNSTVTTKAGVFTIVDDTVYSITITSPDGNSDTKLRYNLYYHELLESVTVGNVTTTEVVAGPVEDINSLPSPGPNQSISTTNTAMMTRDTAYAAAMNFCGIWANDQNSVAAELHEIRLRASDVNLGIATTSAFTPLDRAMLIVSLRSANLLNSVNTEMLHPSVFPFPEPPVGP